MGWWGWLVIIILNPGRHLSLQALEVCLILRKGLKFPVMNFISFRREEIRQSLHPPNFFMEYRTHRGPVSCAGDLEMTQRICCLQRKAGNGSKGGWSI